MFMFTLIFLSVSLYCNFVVIFLLMFTLPIEYCTIYKKSALDDDIWFILHSIHCLCYCYVTKWERSARSSMARMGSSLRNWIYWKTMQMFISWLGQYGRGQCQCPQEDRIHLNWIEEKQNSKKDAILKLQQMIQSLQSFVVGLPFVEKSLAFC